MAKVVYLTDRKPIPPKTITDTHAGQRYTCTYDPNAPPHERWVWVVHFKRTYQFYGACSTAEAATKQARKRIHTMTLHQQMEEEGE
jgi:hypothetical protein